MRKKPTRAERRNPVGPRGILAVLPEAALHSRFVMAELIPVNVAAPPKIGAQTAGVAQPFIAIFPVASPGIGKRKYNKVVVSHKRAAVDHLKIHCTSLLHFQEQRADFLGIFILFG